MGKFENVGIIKVEVKIARVRYAVNENGECVVHVQDFWGMNAKKAAATVKKENKGKVIILEKSFTVRSYNVIGGTFVERTEQPDDDEEPEETEE